MKLSIVDLRKDGQIRVPNVPVFGNVESDLREERLVEYFHLSVRLRGVCGCREML